MFNVYYRVGKFTQRKLISMQAGLGVQKASGLFYSRLGRDKIPPQVAIKYFKQEVVKYYQPVDNFLVSCPPMSKMKLKNKTYKFIRNIKPDVQQRVNDRFGTDSDTAEIRRGIASGIIIHLMKKYNVDQGQIGGKVFFMNNEPVPMPLNT